MYVVFNEGFVKMSKTDSDTQMHHIHELHTEAFHMISIVMKVTFVVYSVSLIPYLPNTLDFYKPLFELNTPSEFLFGHSKHTAERQPFPNLYNPIDLYFHENAP